jgi:hypothetical protein
MQLLTLTKMKKIVATSTVIWLVSGFPMLVAAKQPTPVTVARQFYRWNIEYNNDDLGLPSEKQLEPIAGLLDPTLSRALHQTKTVESCVIKATPAGNKPDLFEGRLFVNNYDGIDRINSLKVSARNNTATITASLSLQSSAWVDRLKLHKKSGQWLIVDIEFESKIGKKLTNILSSYVQKYRSTCKA